MRNFETIQERINAKADAELRNNLRKIMNSLTPYLSHTDSDMYLKVGDQYHKMSGHSAKDNLEKHIIKEHKEDNRDAASREFLSKMEQMHEQFDEMIGFEEE